MSLLFFRLFAAVIGSGLQIFSMLAITIFFAMLGMLSPASRGALLTAAIFLYEFMGLIAGYYAGRLYKTMKGKEWKVRRKKNCTTYFAVYLFEPLFINVFLFSSAHSFPVLTDYEHILPSCMFPNNFCVQIPVINKLKTSVSF
jgi:transmembrane 9 superfamily protein 2/4